MKNFSVIVNVNLKKKLQPSDCTITKFNHVNYIPQRQKIIGENRKEGKSCYEEKLIKIFPTQGFKENFPVKRSCINVNSCEKLLCLNVKKFEEIIQTTFKKLKVRHFKNCQLQLLS